MGWMPRSASSADCPIQNLQIRPAAQQEQAVAGSKGSKNLWTDEQGKAEGATISCFIREIRQEYMRTIWPRGYFHIDFIYGFSWPLGWSSQLVPRWVDDKQTWDTVVLFLSAGFLKLILFLLHAVVGLPLLHSPLKGNYAWNWIA